MITNKKPFCAVPYTIAFTAASTFRDCCSKKKSEQIFSSPGQTFADWWSSNNLNAFRQEFNVETWQELSTSTASACNSCYISEKDTGHSFRIAINKTVNNQIDYRWPNAWNMKFGNTCNLGCWICNENASSVIMHHKKQAHIPLLIDYDPEQEFKKAWPDLEKNILRSYDYHNIVTITIVGGEPLYNRDAIKFLNRLIDLNLHSRTRLEFHTNGTVRPDRILPVDKRIWNHVSIFVSIDAIGSYAEWLRYGGKWSKIDRTIDQLFAAANYSELHCVLSILNINQLPELEKYAHKKNVKLNINTLSSPEFMALEHWDQSVESLLVMPVESKFQTYYDLIGTNPIPGTSKELKKFIDSFKSVRKPLSDFDPEFASLIGW